MILTIIHDTAIKERRVNQGMDKPNVLAQARGLGCYVGKQSCQERPLLD